MNSLKPATLATTEDIISSDDLFQATEKLKKIQHFGFRMSLLGIAPETYLERKSALRAALHAHIFVFQTCYAFYETIVSMFLAPTLLVRVNHVYIASYFIILNFQWAFFLRSIRELIDTDLKLEGFNCTKVNPSFAAKQIAKNYKLLKNVLVPTILWWCVQLVAMIIGPAVEAVVSFTRFGEVDDISIFPTVFILPKWCQMLLYVFTSSSVSAILLYCTGSSVVMFIRVIKLRALCTILNEALKNDVEELSKIRGYIMDHIKIIKNATELNKHLANLNSLMFMICYLGFATQMFTLTLSKPDGSFYVGLIFDSFSTFLLVSLQCWMGSEITHSLESLSSGVHNTIWYERNKAYGNAILIMTRMTQRRYVQKIWLGSLNIEMVTTIKLIRSSYAAYTLLAMLQN